MIQRIQSLLLLEVAFLSVSLLFVPVQFIISEGTQIPLSLVPLSHETFTSSIGHYGAVAINALAMLLAFITIFLYKKRELQVKLCYVLVLLYLSLVAMLAFCPFVSSNQNNAETNPNILAYIILLVAAGSSFMAARFVKKDIELLKSTDRIR